MADIIAKNIVYASWLREQAANKRPYWYGTYYQLCAEKLLDRKTAQYPAHYTSSRMARYRQDISDGQICGDCVNGAIKGAVWSELGTRAPVYASHGCPDTNADGMFKRCKGWGMDWGTIDSMPDVPGVAVRMSGHVGVYVGNGEVVEWRGFAYGCVLTKLANRPWLHWYKLPWIEYAEAADTAPVTATLGDRLLKRGMTGEDVSSMQALLIDLSYSCGNTGADGDFGVNTKAAVKTFQAANELTADGQYGPLTHAALMAAQADDAEPDEGDAPTTTGTIEVTGGSVWVRTGPGTQYDRVTVVHKGDQLASVGESGGWHCVIIGGGTGWIGPKYTKMV